MWTVSETRKNLLLVPSSMILSTLVGSPIWIAIISDSHRQCGTLVPAQNAARCRHALWDNANACIVPVARHLKRLSKAAGVPRFSDLWRHSPPDRRVICKMNLTPWYIKLSDYSKLGRIRRETHTLHSLG